MAGTPSGPGPRWTARDAGGCVCDATARVGTHLRDAPRLLCFRAEDLGVANRAGGAGGYVGVTRCDRHVLPRRAAGGDRRELEVVCVLRGCAQAAKHTARGTGRRAEAGDTWIRRAREMGGGGRGELRVALPCRLSGWGGTVSYYVTTMRECAALSEVRVSLPARLAPPGGQGRVVGVRVAAPANEMQVCWSLSGAARVGWLRCVRVCSLKLCPGNAPCCGGLPEEEKA